MVPSKMKILERKGTSIIATREEEQLLISEQSEVNLVSEEMSWVVNSEASFCLTPAGNASHHT